MVKLLMDAPRQNGRFLLCMAYRCCVVYLILLLE